MADVSVIIPVWNTQDYLNQCLDSVQNQTLSRLDIMCVDDGSSDRSVDIIQARAGADSWIRLLKTTDTVLAHRVADPAEYGRVSRRRD